MASLFGAPSPSIPPMPPLPNRDDDEIKRRKEQERQARIRRTGMKDTIKTPNLGTLGEAPVKKPTLLGGGI